MAAGVGKGWRNAFLVQAGLVVLLAVLLVLRAGPGEVIPATLLMASDPQSPEARVSRDATLGFFDDSVVPRVRAESVDAAVPAQGAAVVPVDHGAAYKDAAALKSMDGARWVLQVLAVSSEGAAKSFIDGRDDKDKLFYYQTLKDGAPWFVVLYGDFPSRELALGVMEAVDFGLVTRPFPRSITALQADVDAVGESPAIGAVAAPVTSNPDVKAAE